MGMEWNECHKAPFPHPLPPFSATTAQKGFPCDCLDGTSTLIRTCPFPLAPLSSPKRKKTTTTVAGLRVIPNQDSPISKLFFIWQVARGNTLVVSK